MVTNETINLFDVPQLAEQLRENSDANTDTEQMMHQDAIEQLESNVPGK